MFLLASLSLFAVGSVVSINAIAMERLISNVSGRMLNVLAGRRLL